MDNAKSLTTLLNFLEKLEAATIHYTLSAPTLGYRAIMVSVVVPGEIWEVEFHEDGEIGVETFVSSEGVTGPERLEELFSRFSD